MKNLLLNLILSIVVGIIIGVIGFVMFNWELGYNLVDAAVIYLAAVVGGGCCWIGLNLRDR